MSKQFTKIRARFQPKRFEPKPQLKELVGSTFEFEYVWFIEESEHSKFAGQWALTTDDPRFNGLWVPEEDLEIVSPEI